MFISVSFAAWNQAEINRIFNDASDLPSRCITPSPAVLNSHITAPSPPEAALDKRIIPAFTLYFLLHCPRA
jgi:hypothetical protein